MEESTCHEMVIYPSQKFSSMLCVCVGGGGVVCTFLHFFISPKYDFHVDVERMIVKTREM